MRDFIEAISGVDKLDFTYGKFDSIFVKREYDSYYLFFFLKNKEQLLELREEAGEVFHAIKGNKELYRPDMDKNTTCIFCLCVSESEYYEIGESGEISELSKMICLVEEDLNYFKKNVLLYTDKMEAFARRNKGKFESICKQYLTEKYFQTYKKSSQGSFEYDFLLNLFIKIPFLSFNEYQQEKRYQTMEAFIEERCRAMEIDQEDIDKISKELEKFESEDKLYQWVDMLLEEQEKKDKGVTEDENQKS